MKKSILAVFLMTAFTVVLLNPFEAKSQISLCDIMGITERDTGIVYCIGVGYTHCAIPCSNQ